MIRHYLSAVALALMFAAGPAFAASCPMDMAAIDAAMPKASLSDAQKSEVMKLRAEGEALHKAGQHQESMAKLAEAKKILNVK